MIQISELLCQAALNTKMFLHFEKEITNFYVPLKKQR